MKKVIIGLSSLIISSLAHASPYTVHCYSYADDGHNGECSFYTGVTSTTVDATSILVKFTCSKEPKNPATITVAPSAYSTHFTVGNGGAGCSSSKDIKTVQLTFKQSNGQIVETSTLKYSSGGPTPRLSPAPVQVGATSDAPILTDSAKNADRENVYVSNWSKPKGTSCWHIDGYSGCAKKAN
ncbi:hypothetical protein L4C34_11835 [Vibrio profundum]|uniref:hypothetical protein n=1 Tax=Vibrio profundum TaxID=2910247 RepID=UPI003D0C5825